jgi:hypothetical protein
MVNFAQIGTTAAAALAPFMLTANAGALADECKKAPAPLDSNRPALIDLSRRTPVLIAQAQPANCPPRDAITVLQERGQRVIDGLEAWDQKRRSLPPVPGG